MDRPKCSPKVIEDVQWTIGNALSSRMKQNLTQFQSDGKKYYWHRPHEKLQRHQIKQTIKHGGGSLMVWGCFTW